MTFAHVDDALRPRGIEADDDGLAGDDRPQRRPAAAARRREVRLPDVGFQPVLDKRAGDTIL
jgi:hypothetical protein